MQLKNEIFVLVLVPFLSVHVNSQVIFEDEPEQQTTRRQFDKVVVITVEPQKSGGFRQVSQQTFQRPNNGFGFGNNNNNNNNGFGNSGTSFSSASASAGGGFQPQNPNNFQNQQGFFQPNPPNNFHNQQQQQGFQNQNEVFPDSPSPDCRTYRNTGGFCTPLTSCSPIARAIQNRPPFVAARVLQRSICGFSGVIPNVCCPTSRFQQRPPSPPPFQNQNNNNFGGGNNGVGNDGFNKNNQNENNVKNPGNNNGGGGLVIIPPTTPTSQVPPPPSTTTRTTTTTTTTTTPPPIKTKKPQGTGGGLIIGDGPIALLPPQKGGSSNPLGFSDEGLPADCGFSNASHTRIVGGKIAEKGAWPWIAALGYKDNAGNINYLCGGALISPNYVVTASHCLHGRNDLATVRLGDHELFSNSDGVTPMEVEVDKEILHPNYDPNTFKNDIALLRLKRSIPYSLQIHPICLPNSPKLRNERFENTSPFVAGWGAIQFNGPASSVLREVQIPTVPDDECQQKYSAFKTAVVDDTNICAGLQRGGKDACQGDSGGPLQQPVGTNRYVLIGVVSFGFKCAEPDFPGIYTRVTSHLDWIESTISKN